MISVSMHQVHTAMSVQWVQFSLVAGAEVSVYVDNTDNDDTDVVTPTDLDLYIYTISSKLYNTHSVLA